MNEPRESVVPLGSRRGGRTTMFRLFAFAWVTMTVLLVAIIAVSHQFVGALAVGLMFGLGGYFLIRAAYVSAWYDSDILFVRNCLRSHKVDRHNIDSVFVDDVRVGGAGGRYKTIYARLQDGLEIPLSACGRSLVLDASAESKLAEERERLAQWLAGNTTAR